MEKNMSIDELESVSSITECKTKANENHMHTERVVKNSFLLIVQPLALNVISIFATAYIARVLGTGDYGKFTFALAFVGMFAPFVNVGLRTITIRELAENKSIMSYFLGRMITLRAFLGLAAMAMAMIVINILGYPSSIINITYIFSASLLFGAIGSTFIDTFQAHEKMEYVALTQFISGSVLTLLSVAVLYMGFRLIGLIMAYTFGSLLALFIGFLYMRRKYIIPRFTIDLRFCRENLKKGAPFFYPTLVASLTARVGIIILSKFSGDVSVGIYGAAVTLVDRLIIIPDGMCTAIFPTLARLYKTSTVDAARIYRQFFIYLILLGLPIAVGTTILAEPIIMLIFGAEYVQAVPILQMLAWWLFFTFLTYIQSLALGAIHQEHIAARVRLVTAISGVVITFILVLWLGANGLAIASCTTAILYFLYLNKPLKQYMIRNLISPIFFVKIITSILIMAAVTFLMRNLNLFLAITAGVLSYVTAVLLLRLASVAESKMLFKTIMRR